MRLADIVEVIEARLSRELDRVFAYLHAHLDTRTDQIMATITQVADQIGTLATTVPQLTAAVNTLVQNQANGGAQQAAFEAQLEPLNAALEQLNAATGTLLGVVNAANGTV